MPSVFTVHRDKVLGYYGAAAWLRSLVLSMWNGTDYQVGLSKLASLDSAHVSAALAMIQAYSQHGEGDAVFMTLAEECLLREQRRAARRFESRWTRRLR